jgi:ribonuclease P protein subunit RPR2
MANKHQLIKEKAKKQAKTDILKYLDLAKKSFKQDSKKSNLYVHKARLLAMKHNIRLPKELKRTFCKHCYSYLVPGVNCRVRTREGKLIYYCLNCKRYMRIPLKK